MKRFKLLLLFLLLNAGILTAKTIHVAIPGTLPNYISDAEKYDIEELTLTGDLNGTDFRLIRDMAGNNYNGESTDGILKKLDLSGANIVAGGDGYYTIIEDLQYFITTSNEVSCNLFEYCNLEQVVLPNSVTCIREWAFGSCSQLKSIFIPASVTSIGEGAFEGCENLVSCNLPEGLNTIENAAFGFCRALTAVEIPSSLKSLGMYVFVSCDNLEKIVSKINDPDRISYKDGESTLFDDNTYNKATLYVPYGTKYIYQRLVGWKKFSKIEEMPAELAQEINVERYAGQGYFTTEAVVDFTSAKEFLGVEEITYDMLRIVNPNGEMISDYAPYDGWFNKEGVAETWGANTKICVKFFQAIGNDGKYEICDMNSADELGKTYTVKWALVANGKKVVYTINVTFVERPVITLKFDDLNVVDEKTIDFNFDVGSMYQGGEATVDVAAILAKLGVESIDDLTICAVQSDGSLDDDYKLSNTDGWRNADGDWQSWGADAFFMVKADFADSEPQIYDVGTMDPKVNPSVNASGTYTAKYVFFKENDTNDAVVLNVVVRLISDDEITITAKNYTRQYGGANPTFEYVVTGGTIKGTPVITCQATKKSPVGTYPIVIDLGSVSNSVVMLVNGTLTIDKAPLKIIADNKTMTQGDDLPELTVSYQGFKNGEDSSVLTQQPTIMTTATKQSAPGTYPINVSGGSAKNYSLSYQSGTLTIEKSKGHELVVLLQNGQQEKYLLSDKPRAQFIGDQLRVHTTLGPITYNRADIKTFYFGCASSSYEPVLLTANDCTREYGDANPRLTYIAEGGSVSGNPTLKTTANSTSSVGDYSILIGKGSVDNDNVTFVNGTLLVTKAPLIVTADDQTMEQGDLLPELTFSYKGFKNGESESVLTRKPVASTSATSQSNPGEYPIVVADGSATNYKFIYKYGTLTIEQPVYKGHTLYVLFNDGRKEAYSLEEQPRCNFSGSRLVIRTSSVTAEFERAEIKECTFEDPEAVDVEEIAETVDLHVQMENDRVIVSGLDAGEKVLVYDVSGRMHHSVRAEAGGSTSVMLPEQAGLYIIQISNKRTIKIQKR